MTTENDIIKSPTLTSTETTVGNQKTKTPDDVFEHLLGQIVNDPTYLTNAKYVSVNLFEDYVELDLGANVKKQVSYNDFRNILSKTIVDTSEVQITGLLPPSNLIFFAQTPKQIRLSAYYPSSIRQLAYGAKKMEIATPNMIISHILNKDGSDWVVSSTRFFCTDQAINKLPKTFINEVNSQARIWISPLSNTYSEGRMCYGSNSMPVRFKDNNLRGLDYYYKFLWETPFNDDLGIPGLGRGFGVSNWYNHLQDIAKEKKAFPYDSLQGWSKHPDGLIPALPIR